MSRGASPHVKPGCVLAPALTMPEALRMKYVTSPPQKKRKKQKQTKENNRKTKERMSIGFMTPNTSTFAVP
jgi:hypothetical protein